jgi:hypothetical protein
MSVTGALGKVCADAAPVIRIDAATNAAASARASIRIPPTADRLKAV